MIRTLHTIGYTGLSIHEFIEELTEARIDLLIDIRELPISRKRGFSKTALTENLASAGIEYSHLKWLGSPKALRHEVRESKDYNKFFGGVAKHLCQANASAQLQEAIRLARRVRSCLMCCCPDWKYCHRRCVVDAILENSHFSIKHLWERPVERPVRKAA